MLREKAKKAPKVDASIIKLIDDLAETMLAAPGAGLAAPQIGVPLRVFVVRGEENQVIGLVNPELLRGEGVQVGYEGCLSYPGWVGEVARYQDVVIKGRNRHGKLLRRRLVGNIVEHYKRITPGKLALAFAVSRAHSEHLAEQFRAAGVSAQHLDGETDKNERARLVAAYRRREIEVLTNVNLFSAGFDVPGVADVEFVGCRLMFRFLRF